MRVERLPFTVYDVLGYLFPGLLLLVGVSLIAEHVFLIAIFDTVKSLDTPKLVFVSIFSFISAYSIGHAVGLMSSVTLEKLVTTFVAYPSEFLLSEYAYKGAKESYNKKIIRRIVLQHANGNWRSFAVAIVRILFFPLVIILYIVTFSGFIFHMVKRLDNKPVQLLDKRFSAIFADDRTRLAGREWFSLVEYIVWHHSPGGAPRMYNYLTIYGFCRNSSFVFYVLGVILLYAVMRQFFTYGAPVTHWMEVWVAVFCLSMSAVLLFGFMKFYRRYSYEAISSFIVLNRDVVASLSVSAGDVANERMASVVEGALTKSIDTLSTGIIKEISKAVSTAVAQEVTEKLSEGNKTKPVVQGAS
jgi:hypothetical protein